MIQQYHSFIYSLYSHKTHTWIYIGTLFIHTLLESRNNPSPSVGEGINELWYIHNWNITLKKKKSYRYMNNTGSSVLDLKCSRSMKETRFKGCIPSESIYLTLLKRQNSRGIKWVSVCQGLGVREQFKYKRAWSFCRCWNFKNLDCDDDYRNIRICQN